MLAGLIRSEVRQLNPAVGIGEITTMAAQVHELLDRNCHVRRKQRGSRCCSACSLPASAFTAALTQSVDARWKEYALRLALGARLRHVVWKCVRALATVLVAGAGIGYLVSVPLRGVTRSLLFGTIDEGAATVLLSVLIVLVVSAVAATAPLLRLRRFDLATALRRD